MAIISPNYINTGLQQFDGTTNTVTYGARTFPVDALAVICVQKLGGSVATTVTNITIGGTACTVVAGASSTFCRAVGYAPVLAGSHVPVITFSGIETVTRDVIIFVYYVTGYYTPGITTSLPTTNNSTVHTNTLSMPANSATIFWGAYTTTSVMAFSTASEDQDTSSTNPNSRYGSARKTTTSAIPSHAETITHTTSTTGVLSSINITGGYTVQLTKKEITVSKKTIIGAKTTIAHLTTKVVNVSRKTITPVYHRGMKATTKVINVSLKTIVSKRENLRARLATAIITIKGGWHTPRKDELIRHRKVNRWWKQLVHWH